MAKKRGKPVDEIPWDGSGNPRELYAAFHRGWRDNARTRSVDEAFTKHPTRAHDLGLAYTEGRLAYTQAQDAALQSAMKRYGYAPSILRGDT